MGCGINRSASGDDIGNLGGRFERIQIEDHQMSHRTIARDIQTTGFDVRENIVKTAVAANFGCLQDLIRSVGRSALGQYRGRQDHNRSKYDWSADSSHETSPQLA